MTRLICALLTLLFSLSGPAMGGYSSFDRSSLAAKTALPMGPGASKINELPSLIRAAGKYDAGPVGSVDEALELARKAFPDAVHVPDAVPGLPYPKPPPGVKQWFQVHPAEPGVNELPHVKYNDWTGGKKGTGGSWGHIFFEDE